MAMIAATLLVALLLETTEASTTKVCPILGPSFPQPTNIASSKVFKDAAAIVNHQIEVAIKTNNSPIGHLPYNKTTFSLSTFSSRDEGLSWQSHYTSKAVADSPVGVHHVDADTVYEIGSISKLMTMYTFLILDGDKKLNDPVSQYVPELVELQKNASTAYGVLPIWDEITIGDLAAQSGGIDADYGLDDIEFEGDDKGLPPLPKSRIPKCNYGGRKHWRPCDKQQEIDGLVGQPALFAAASTPSYSNLGYDILGFAFETILKEPFGQSFHRALVENLGLNRTWYKVPPNPSVGAIPVSETASGWNQELEASNPDGGNAMSTNDMAIIGKSMLNSSLLPPSVTRRWIKPRTFTSNPNFSVGAPWEIFRWETPNKLYDIYTKDGGVGHYASTFGIIPDLDFGFTALTTGAKFEPGVQLHLGNLMMAQFLPAVEELARQQAEQNFAGKYSDSRTNSTLVITTDDQPGLRVTEWTSNGKSVLDLYTYPSKGHFISFRLFPNQLYAVGGGKIGFTASYQTLPQDTLNVPMPHTCQTWGNTGFTQYGNAPLGLFVFNIKAGSGAAMSVDLGALAVTLTKES